MQSNILKSLKEKIPNSFRVGGSTFYVNIVENSEKDLNGALGDSTNLLHLHELGHCFGYYFNGDTSEEFACAFSNFFFEYLITKK